MKWRDGSPGILVDTHAQWRPAGHMWQQIRDSSRGRCTGSAQISSDQTVPSSELARCRQPHGGACGTRIPRLWHSPALRLIGFNPSAENPFAQLGSFSHRTVTGCGPPHTSGAARGRCPPQEAPGRKCRGKAKPVHQKARQDSLDTRGRHGGGLGGTAAAPDSGAVCGAGSGAVPERPPAAVACAGSPPAAPTALRGEACRPCYVQPPQLLLL